MPSTTATDVKRNLIVWQNFKHMCRPTFRRAGGHGRVKKPLSKGGGHGQKRLRTTVLNEQDAVIT